MNFISIKKIILKDGLTALGKTDDPGQGHPWEVVGLMRGRWSLQVSFQHIMFDVPVRHPYGNIEKAEGVC